MSVDLEVQFGESLSESSSEGCSEFSEASLCSTSEDFQSYDDSAEPIKGPIVNYVPGGGGGAVVLEGGTILKQAPFWGLKFSLVRNMRGVKFYDTATAV